MIKENNVMEEPEAPSMLRRGRNFAGAVVRIGKAAINGDTIFCPDFDSEQRIRMCESCDMFRASDRICTHNDCGCFIDKKARLSTERCPMAKWPGDILL